MSVKPFPAEPSSRRVLMVLSEHDIEKAGYTSGGADLLDDDEMHVISTARLESDGQQLALRNVIDSGLIRPGAMLVQSPFDLDWYEDASEAPEKFALAKHMYFSTLCGRLGAKEVKVEQVVLQTSRGSAQLDLTASGKGIKGTGKLEMEDLERLKAQMSLHDTFQGADPDVAAAKELLRTKKLWADPNMRTLVEMRQGHGNQLLTRRLTISLSNEAKRNLRVVGRLAVPAGISLASNYERARSTEYDYTVTVSVAF